MRGILREKPPMPRYRILWDVDQVLSYLKGLPDNKNLTLKLLSMKLTILLAIAAPKRVSELAHLDLRFMSLTPECVNFRLPGLSKTQRDCTPKQVTYHRFSDSRVCVLECLHAYLDATKNFRNKENSEVRDPLLRAVIKPHKGITANTISNWIKKVMALSGIDTQKFQAHSTRGASTSKASNKGVSLHEILDMADWTNVSTFRNFYSKPVITANSFGNAVLSCGK
jgi:site-specific recombinase XerD